MTEKLKNLYLKYKVQILYVLFGALTTFVNIVSYHIFYYNLNFPNVSSTVIALILCVLTAFITNKIWVFDSRSFALKTVVYEALTFFSCRALTGVLDVGIMYLSVDILAFNGLLMKTVSNVIVIVLNYIASKLIIFK